MTTIMQNNNHVAEVLKNALLSEKEVAARWSISIKTLQAWRAQPNKGPLFIKLGRAVRYRYAEIVSFEERQMKGSTYE
jgi:hypothetical protein